MGWENKSMFLNPFINLVLAEDININNKVFYKFNV